MSVNQGCPHLPQIQHKLLLLLLLVLLSSCWNPRLKTAMASKMLLLLLLHLLACCAPVTSKASHMQHNPAESTVLPQRHPRHLPFTVPAGRPPTSTSWFITLNMRLMPVSHALS
jgi:hypothetical protein